MLRRNAARARSGGQTDRPARPMRVAGASLSRRTARRRSSARPPAAAASSRSRDECRVDEDLDVRRASGPARRRCGSGGRGSGASSARQRVGAASPARRELAERRPSPRHRCTSAAGRESGRRRPPESRRSRRRGRALSAASSGVDVRQVAGEALPGPAFVAAAPDLAAGGAEVDARRVVARSAVIACRLTVHHAWLAGRPVAWRCQLRPPLTER